MPCWKWIPGLAHSRRAEPHSQPSLSYSYFSAKRKNCEIKSGDGMIPTSLSLLGNHKLPGCRKLQVCHQLQANRRVLIHNLKWKEHQAECGGTGQQSQHSGGLQRVATNLGYTTSRRGELRGGGGGERRGKEEEEAEDNDDLNSVNTKTLDI